MKKNKIIKIIMKRIGIISLGILPLVLIYIIHKSIPLPFFVLSGMIIFFGWE